MQIRFRIPIFLLVFLTLFSCLCACSGTGTDENAVGILFGETEPPIPGSPDASESSVFSDVRDSEEAGPTETETTVFPEETVSEEYPDTEIQTTETGAETEPVLLTVPAFLLEPLDEVSSLLDDAGIVFTVEYEHSVYPKNSVILANFIGAAYEDYYEIRPDRPVTLTVSLGRAAQHKNVTAPDEKIIYLTFDDGPGKLTEDFLSVLDTYHVRATFFMVGQYISYRPSTAKKVYEAGHAIGCHSNSHDYMALYASVDAASAEIAAWEQAAEAAIGVRPTAALFRFPGGSNTRYMTYTRKEDIYWSLHDAGFRCFDWTFADNDRYLQGKPESQNVTEYLRNSVISTLAAIEKAPALPKIMLMHDTSPETLEILPWIIEYLTEKGYSFGTLDELDGDWLFP